MKATNLPLFQDGSARPDSILDSSSVDNEDEIAVMLVKIDNIDYYAENEMDSDIYSCVQGDEIGDFVGKYVLGVPVLE